MTEEEKRRIIDALNSRRVGKVCPMCGQKGFSIAEGFLTDLLLEDYRMESGHRKIPSILVICNNCGYMSRHALGTLGLMNDNTKMVRDMDNIKWLKAAIYWINDMANPNEGMSHPLDDNKLKSIANLIASLNVKIDDDIIKIYAKSLGIIDESIDLIIKTFKKAKRNKFIITDAFPEDFLKLRLKEIAKEKLID